tara:strand:+ start:600 stop:1721 length:1122 start_codon:yes stop_codon:yes gene_type:complete
MVTVIEQEIYASSLCFYGTTRPTDTGTAISLGESFALDVSSLFLYRNREPNPAGGVTPTPKIVNRISIEPLWDVSYITPSSIVVGASTFTAYFADVLAQPFIASQRLNNLTQNFFGFSATADLEWKTNQYGPGGSMISPVVHQYENDVHYSDKFVLHPWEDLKFKLQGATLVDDFPGSTSPVLAARKAVWEQQWVSNPNPVLKVRVELEEFNPSSQYYKRVSLNDVTPKSGGYELYSDENIMLLDLRTSSPTLLEKPFDRLSSLNNFQLDNLDFRSAFPWGGKTPSKFMYSIILHTEGAPTATRYIRKYIKFDAGTTSNLEINGLLKDIGPLTIEVGQYLTAVIYEFESRIVVSTEALTARQMPAFWLNGSIT